MILQLKYTIGDAFHGYLPVFLLAGPSPGLWSCDGELRSMRRSRLQEGPFGHVKVFKYMPVLLLPGGKITQATVNLQWWSGANDINNLSTKFSCVLFTSTNVLNF